MEKTITMKEIMKTNTWSVKDDSPRGCATVSCYDVKPGDKVVFENRFTLVVDDEPETENAAETAKTEEKTEEKKGCLAMNTTTNKTTMEEIIAKIIEWFEEHEDEFNETIEELDSYNGYLGDDRYYSMDELSEFYCNCDPIELLNRAYYGRDDDGWNTDSSGNKIYNSFCPNREYFYYNGYGNLCSTDWKDYSDKLDNYFVKSILEEKDYTSFCVLDDNNELNELFNELEKLNNENDE